MVKKKPSSHTTQTLFFVSFTLSSRHLLFVSICILHAPSIPHHKSWPCSAHTPVSSHISSHRGTSTSRTRANCNFRATVRSPLRAQVRALCRWISARECGTESVGVREDDGGVHWLGRGAGGRHTGADDIVVAGFVI